MMKSDDLIAYVFQDQPHLLSGGLDQLMEDSSRFTGFVETYRDSIHGVYPPPSSIAAS